MALTFSCRNPVAFRIEQSTDLCQIAATFDNVFDRSGFHQVSIIAIALPRSPTAVNSIQDFDVNDAFNRVLPPAIISRFVDAARMDTSFSSAILYYLFSNFSAHLSTLMHHSHQRGFIKRYYSIRIQFTRRTKQRLDTAVRCGSTYLLT